MRHTLDVMHVEKNVAATITGFLLGDDNTIAVQKDLQECAVMEELHLVRQGDIDNFLMPHASYVLRPEEKRRMLETIKKVHVLSGHCANSEKLVNMEKGKLQFLKSHDWHVLIEEILPAAL